ncbi:outer membrane protein transport protein [Acinetobacter sp. YH12239]|uniref:outer membrane protein transport protein n=1 Tax=Acinetobacter sp. YH12239 TaxID=2601166 RepID=UPI0015D4223C|nr:outer membrane protein transport protein [Acinetobacter sp. YH12239]
MRLNTLTGAILVAMFPTAGAYAAAMDRSGQSMNGFLQPGNYVDFSYSILDADLSGTMRTEPSGPASAGLRDPNGWNMPTADDINAGGEIAGTNLSDIADTFGFANINLKFQVTDNISLGLIYDQPFGAKASYSNFDKKHSRVNSSGRLPLGDLESATKYGAFHSEYGSTKAEVSTNSLSLVVGFQPNEHLNFYAGPVYQTVKGDLSLQGTAYSLLGGYLCNSQTSGVALCSTFKEKGTGSRDLLGRDTRKDYQGYKASMPEEGAFGWLAGAAFQIPEIALRASLTYRSKISYSVQAEESMPEVITDTLPIVHPGWHIVDKIGALGTDYQYTEGKTSAATPQSVNLDFQSGIMADTLAYINLRWVDWSEFKIRPYKFGVLTSSITEGQGKGPRGFDLIAYEKDQISATFGIARKLNEKLALTIIGGWDSGAGEYVSTLGPSEGFWSAGLGGQYSFNKNTFIQAGARYFWLGDAKAQSASWFGTDRYDADFKDNTAIGYSFKIGYRF